MSRAAQALAWAAASPGLIVGVGILTGLGLARDVSPIVALTAAVLIVILPAVGLSSLFKHHPVVILVAALGWSAAITAGTPTYFPGERGAALRTSAEGVFSAQTLSLAEPLLDALEDAPYAARLPVVPAQTPAPPPEQAAVRSEPVANPEPTAWKVHFEGVGRSLQVPVLFATTKAAVEVPMIFDTGATMTTLSVEMADLLGAKVIADAPQITLRTAGGTRVESLGLIDQVTMGGAMVEGITVAICDGCAPGPAQGLLGLNFSGQFLATVNHEDQAIELEPRGEGLDRLIDVTPWIKLKSRANRRLGGDIKVEIEARNLSPRAVKAVDVEVACQGDAFSVQIDNIPPLGEASTIADLPEGTDCESYTVGLIGARW